LRDFDETLSCRKLDKKTPDELQQAIQDRKDLADKHGDDWGKKWIILPNPAYGEWMKPLGRGRSDLDRLAPPLATK
jgi:predicted secreted acid phosphatase